MSAVDCINDATCALGDINRLILYESQEVAEGDTGDASSDVVTLRAAQKLLTEYIAATSLEVGDPDDLEDVADDSINSLIRSAAGYYG